MADVDWGSEDNQPKKKKRIPTWAWITGGCCGVALLGVIGLVVAGGFLANKVANQGENWADLARVLPYDESYKGDDKTVIQVPFQPGVDDVFQVVDSANPSLQMHVRSYSGERAESVRKRIFDELDTSALRELGMLKVVDPLAGVIELQGRTLKTTSFFTHRVEEGEASESSGGDLGVMDAFKLSVRVVDATPENASGLVLVHLNHLGSSKRVPDETLVDALRPFHIGPVR